MPDLAFQIEGAEPQRSAAEPALRFRLRVTEAAGEPIHTAMLRCQIRIEPGRRRYTAAEQQRLLDLFGTPERWGQTVRPMLWTHVSALLTPFTGSTDVSLPVPCSSDFSLAATKYFEALEEGDLPLCFLFSGTVFYEGPTGALQVAQIAWEKEASFRLPAATWHSLMQTYYPNSAWLSLRKDVFDQLNDYRSHMGLATWEQVIERLLTTSSSPLPARERGRG